MPGSHGGDLMVFFVEGKLGLLRIWNLEKIWGIGVICWVVIILYVIYVIIKYDDLNPIGMFRLKELTVF